MMKNRIFKQNKRGAALIIALLTAIIVMLAATLLIGLTKRMVNNHQNRIDVAQISLSELSAADGLAFLIKEKGLSAATENLEFSLAGVVTEFSLIETSSVGIRQGFFQYEGADDALIIPEGNRLVIVKSLSAAVSLVSFYSGDSFQNTVEFEITTDLVPVAGTPFSYNNDNGVIIVFEGDSKSMICVVTSQGIQTSTIIEGRVCSPTSALFGSVSADADPLLIVSSGSGNGTLYNCVSGQKQSLSSPNGTTPTFFSDGTVFGSPSGNSISFGRSAIKDVFSGDFNNDGREDIAFASNYSLSVYSGANGQLFRNIPGGSLISWGSVDGRMGLCGKWKLFDGSEQWFRLGYDGFTTFTPELVYEAGWSGRFYGAGNTLTGFIDGVACVASSSGYILELLSESPFAGDADGSDIDFFQATKDGVEAFFNPASGEGVMLTFSANNSYRGSTFPGETRVFSIYESGGEIRVFHNLEGIKQ